VVYGNCKGKYGFHFELCQGTQGDTHIASGKKSCDGKFVIDLESMQRNRASIFIESGNPKVFLEFGQESFGSLELQKGPHGSSQVVSGKSRNLLYCGEPLGCLSRQCRGIGSDLELRR